MSTVGQLVDRIRREYIYPPGKGLPGAAITNNPLASNGTSITYADGYLDQSEKDAIGPGTLIELDTEITVVATHNATTRTITVNALDRGFVGTTAAAHVTGTRFYVNPPVTRKAIFDAVADAVEQLSGDGLTRIREEEMTSGSAPVEITDGDCLWPLGFLYPETDMTDTQYLTVPVHLVRSTNLFTSGQGIQFRNVSTGKSGYLRYKARFPRPTAESDDLSGSSFGVPSRWEKLILLNATAQVLAGVDIKSMDTEFIENVLAAQGFPTGSGRNIVRHLISVYQLLAASARADFNAEYGDEAMMADVFITDGA